MNNKMKLSVTFAFLFSIPFLSNAEDDKDSRIVGGVETEVGRYPYQVGLVRSASSTFPGCGGVLIAPDTVLTAAHCGNLFTHVIIGRHDLQDASETYETIQIQSETMHPNYCAPTIENDLMIIKLTSASAYSPVNLDDNTQDLSAGTDVTTIGWGSTFYGGFGSPVLREVELDIVSNQECAEQYGGGQITSDMLCAARLGKDSCQGDSGGPLIVKGSSAENDVLVGLVSWGNECASPNYPGVYARVGEKISWIKNEMSRKSTPKETLLAKFKYMLT